MVPFYKQPYDLGFLFCWFIAKSEYKYPRAMSQLKEHKIFVTDPVVVLLVLLVVSFVLVMYESSSVISHKIGLCVLLLWYE